MKDIVSVVTPTYNSSNFIVDTIKSVISQTYTDWELIIVDDCSLDDTLEIVQSYIVKDSRIQLIQLPQNSGASVARNAAIKASKGRYISFLDSDDLWLPDKLEKQLAFMRSNYFAFTYTAYDKINVDSQKFGEIGIPDKVSYNDLLKVCSIGCLTVIYDTKYFGKVYMPSIRKRQDLGLWLKLLKKTKYAYGLSEFDFQNLHFLTKYCLIFFMIIGRVELLSLLLIAKKFLFKN